jgi:spore coat protein U-like protein
MRMNPTLSVFALGFLASGLALRPGLAATVTASFTVSATVVSGCQATPNTQEFKNYAAVTTNATSTISVTCTQPTPYVVSLATEVVPDHSSTITKVTSSGSTSTGSAQPSSPQHAINRGRAIGAGTAAGAGSPQLHAVAERAATPENLAPGASPDSIMVSITY